MTPPATDAKRVLRALPGHGFLPPPADVDALTAAGATQLPHTAEGRATAFAAEVRAFATDFWEFTPGARRTKWANLTDRACGPAAAWLAELERGLDVIPKAQADTVARAVSEFVQKLVTLPPAARAARRLSWLRADNRGDAGWVAAARTVLRTDLPLARLDARLFDWFANGTLPTPIPAVTGGLVLSQPSMQNVNFNPAPTEAPANRPTAAFGCSGWGTGVFLVIVVIRVLIALGGKSSTTPPPSQTPPAYNYPAAPKSQSGFTVFEVRQFYDYERQRSQFPNTTVPPPLGYDAWNQAGRPFGGTSP